eukprot:TRINITY_DN4761_c0_g1_i2.p1 TRINITY_DN4761_c0_g1~~TRINITY_DN4761_c0_g1_i2.p1  ORF type:complete len:246 (+),score=54.26 TRINITY_DN4761_c0_g1_i2:128-865(+)
MSRKRRGRDSRAAAGNDGAIGHARSMQIEGRRSNDQGHHPFLGSRAETMSSMHGSSAGLGSQMSTQSIYSNSTGAGTRPSVNEAFDDGEVQYVQDELAVLNEEVQAGNMRAFGSNTESVFEQLEAIRTQQFELVKSFVDMDQRISEQRNSDHDVQAVEMDFNTFTREFDHEEQNLLQRLDKVTKLVQSFSSQTSTAPPTPASQHAPDAFQTPQATVDEAGFEVPVASSERVTRLTAMHSVSSVDE